LEATKTLGGSTDETLRAATTVGKGEEYETDTPQGKGPRAKEKNIGGEGQPQFGRQVSTKGMKGKNPRKWVLRPGTKTSISEGRISLTATRIA